MVQADSGIGPEVQVQGHRGKGELLGLENNLAVVYVEQRTRVIQVAPEQVRLLDGSAPDWPRLFPRRRE